MSTIINKQLIKEAFANVVENMLVDDATYAKYFSHNYMQYVDGKTLNFTDFVAHMKAQKAALESVKITFKYMVAEGDLVATLHLANAVKKNGGIVEAQINAIFQVANNQIILCDELTHLISGDKSDTDLGSRT